MHRRFLLVLSFGLLCAAPAAHSQKTTLKFASFPPAPGALNKNVLTPWTKAVNAALEGTVEVKLYTGGALGRNPVQQYKLVKDKVADIAYIVMGYTPGDFSDSNIFELPFLVETSLEGSLAHWRMHERHLLRGYGHVKMLGLFTLPAQSLHTKFPIKRIEDIAGRKIRVAGPYQSRALELLGATPVSGIPIPRVAEGISRGVIQGTLSDWNGMIAFRLVGVTKHHFEAPIGTAAAGIAMNTDSYNALPRGARDVIDRLSGAALSRSHGVEFDKRYAANLRRTRKDSSHAFVFPSAAERAALEARLKPITNAWIESNPDGRKLYDALVSIIKDLRRSR